MVLHHLLVHIPRVSLQWLVCLSTVTVRGRGSRSFSGTLPQPPLVSFRFTTWQRLISDEVCHNLFFTYLPAVYKAPYLLAFCDSALEAYEVTTGKWIQTIPFRKVVNLILQTWTHYIITTLHISRYHVLNWILPLLISQCNCGLVARKLKMCCWFPFSSYENSHEG